MVNENLQLEHRNSEIEKPNEVKQSYDGDMLDTVLSHVGDMGRYQKLLYVAMFPFGFTYAFTYFGQIFMTVTPKDHWCKVPELAGLSMELRRNLSYPNTNSSVSNHCMTFNTNWTEVLETLTPPPNGTPLIPCQHGWEFHYIDIPYMTVSTEREWVCDRASYIPLAQSLFFVGSVVGGFLFGWIADRFGRVPALIGTNLIGGIGGVATIFTSGLWDFIICRFLVGMSFDNCFMIVYILVLEYIGPKHRTMAANTAFALSFGTGAMAIPWMAYFIADWRILAWVISLPMFIVLIAPWVLPESTRWLVSVGKVDKAVEVLKSFEIMNGTKIPDDVMNQFIISSNKVKEQKKQSLWNLLKNKPQCIAFVGLVFVHLGCNIVFDGLVRMSDSFGLDFFITFCLTSATELPSNLLLAFMLDKWGRRTLTWTSMVATGLLITIMFFVSKGIPTTVLAIGARSAVNLSFTVTMQWVVELLPTPFRATGSSTLHWIGCVGVIATPFIVYLERYSSILPLIIFAITAFASGIVTIGLPETMGQPMPQTLADGERIAREQSLLYNWKRRDSKDAKKKSSTVVESYRSYPCT